MHVCMCIPASNRPHRTSASSVSRSTYIAVLAPCISLHFSKLWWSLIQSRRMELTASHLLRWAWTVASPLSSHRAPGTNTGQLANRKLQAFSSRLKCDIALDNLFGSISPAFSTFIYFPHLSTPPSSSKLMLLLQPVYILTQTPGVQTRRHQKYRLLQSDSNTPRHRRPLWAHRVAATNHFEQLATPGAAFSIGCWDFFPQ